MYAANLEPDLLDQRLIQLRVEIGGHLFFQKRELVNPGGTGYMNNQDTVLEGVRFGVQRNYLSHGRFPDVPDPGHVRVFDRAVFPQRRGENVAYVNQFVVIVFSGHGMSCFTGCCMNDSSYSMKSARKHLHIFISILSPGRSDAGFRKILPFVVDNTIFDH